jgi:hypothetical protein
VTSQLIHPLALLSFPSPPESSIFSIEPLTGILAASQLSSLEYHILVSPSSSVETLEVLSVTPLVAMDPESPSSRHPTDIEEEDSLL